MKLICLKAILILIIVFGSISISLSSSTTAANGCSPTINYTDIPLYGSFENLKGRVACIVPANYNVVVYIFISGWWVKPTFARPLTSIQADSTWMTDITTGEFDQNATKIVVFLVPNGYNPPLLGGSATLPTELYNNSVIYTQVKRTPRTLNFAGHVWYVKFSDSKVGPGPNYFSGTTSDVWVDDQGRLHLKIVQRDGKWYSTEVYTQESLGYGEYVFYLSSPVNNLDPNVVLGLFTWDGIAPSGDNNREIGIEVSKFGNAANPNNAQYTVQPYTVITNVNPFSLPWPGSQSTHWFAWQADSVKFASYQDHSLIPGDAMETWQYTGTDIPPDGSANARINLWLFNGNVPTDGQEVEVIIEDFQFGRRFYGYLPIDLRNR